MLDGLNAQGTAGMQVKLLACYLEAEAEAEGKRKRHLQRHHMGRHGGQQSAVVARWSGFVRLEMV
jgi:hypothetical protein